MTSDKKCDQPNCGDRAMFRYTWPGEDERVACLIHAMQLHNVAQAMSFHLQLVRLGPGGSGD